MAQLQEQGWEVNNHSKTLQLLRKNTERAGPEPPEPPETQGRLCTKIAAAKIKNTVKGAEASTSPYRYWQSWQGAQATIAALLVYKSLSISCHHFHSWTSEVKSEIKFIHYGKSSRIHMLHTGLESSFTQLEGEKHKGHH